MPKTSDLDTLDKVNITAVIPEEAENFLTFDASTNQLEISELEDEPNIEIPLGKYTVGINLDDEHGGTPSFEIELEILEAPNQEPFY